METLCKGMSGPDVIFLQSRLCISDIDGVYGPKTEEKVIEFQGLNGLKPDGIAGPKTISKLKSAGIEEEDYVKLSQELGCDVPAIKALVQVESGGIGFLDELRPKILFEGHVFYSELKKAGQNVTLLSKKYPNVVYSAWDKKKYRDGQGEYVRFKDAWSINPRLSLLSASQGLFQILGRNYTLAGSPDVFRFWAEAGLGEKQQLYQFGRFIKNSGILPYLRGHQWEEVARRYNGSGYKANRYDEKLRAQYTHFLTP